MFAKLIGKNPEHDSDDLESSGSSDGSDSGAPQPQRKRDSSSLEEESPSSESNSESAKTELKSSRWSVAGLKKHPEAKDFFAAINIGDKFSMESDLEYPKYFVITEAPVVPKGITVSFMWKEGEKYVPIRVRFGLNIKLDTSGFNRYILEMSISGRVATVVDKFYIAPNVSGAEAIKKHKSVQADAPAESPRKVSKSARTVRKSAPSPASPKAKQKRRVNPQDLIRSPAKSQAAKEQSVPHAQKPVPSVQQSPVVASLFEALQLRYTEQVIQSMMEKPEIIAAATDRLVTSPAFIAQIHEEVKAKLLLDQGFVKQIREEAILQERNNPALRAEVEHNISLNLLNDFFATPGEDLTGFEKDAIKRIMSAKK